MEGDTEIKPEQQASSHPMVEEGASEPVKEEEEDNVSYF